MIDAQLKTEIISEIGRFVDIRDEWESVASKLDNFPIHLSYDWLFNWWTILGNKQSVRIIVCRDATGLTGIAVWNIKQRGFEPLKISMIATMGDVYSPRSDIILIRKKKPTLDALEYTRDNFQWHIAEIGRYPTVSCASNSLDLAIQKGLFRGMKRQTLQCPIISVNCSWTSLLASKSVNFRRSVKRNAQRMKLLTFRQFNNSHDTHELENLFKDIEIISRNTWKHQEGTSLAASDKAWTFYRALMRAATEKGNLSISMLYDAETPIAFIFALRCGTCLYAIKTGYDSAYQANCPGFNTLAHLIQLACNDNKIDKVDLDCISSHGDYKIRWATHIEEYTSWRLFRSSLLGTGFYLGYKFGLIFKRLITS